jgi:hypothetical protein
VRRSRDRSLALVGPSSCWDKLHLWKGAFHGSTGFLPTAKISIAAKDAIVYFAERTLGVAVQPKQTASQAETLQ